MVNKKGCGNGYYWNGKECKPWRSREIGAASILTGIVGATIGAIRGNKNQAELDSEMAKGGPDRGPQQQEPKQEPKEKLKKQVVGGSVKKESSYRSGTSRYSNSRRQS